MAYVIPTTAEFKARYQAFSALSDAAISPVLADAVRTVGQPTATRWVEADYAPAIMLLTAHWLITEGALTGGAASNAGEFAGPITKKRVGDIETSYGFAPSGAGSSASGSGDFERTEYGRRYLAMMRANFAGPMVA